MTAAGRRSVRLRDLLLPRPTVAREVLRLATPVTLGMLSFTLLSIVDTAMLGRLGAASLAASGVASVLFFAVVFPLSSMSVGTQTLVSRRFGETQDRLCGQVLNTGWMLCLALGVPLIVLAPWLARVLAPLASNDPMVREAAATYLLYRLHGSVFMLWNMVGQGFLAGIGKTRHQLVGSVLMTTINILLDYLLIFGRGGLPVLGIQGAAIASTISLGVGSAYYLGVLFLPTYRRRFGTLHQPWIALRWLRPMIRLSLPVFAQRLLSNGAWSVFFALVARIGTVELAATNVIRSIYHLAILVGVGLGVAAASLIGQNLGAGRPEHAERMGWETMKLCIYAMLVIGALYLLLPGPIFRIYTRDATVIAVGRLPLMLLGLVQAFAGIALVLSHALQGAGNTRYVMVVEFFSILLYLPTVYGLGLRTPLGLVGAWAGEYVYWIVLAAAMLWKFRKGSWKSIAL